MDELKVKKTALVKINSFIFDNLFNDPSSGFRTNIKLTKISPRSEMSSFVNNDRYFKLPNNSNRFYVFSCSLHSLFGLIPVLNNEWIRSDELNNEYDTCLDIYNNKGLMLPKASAFILLLNQMEREVIVAISYKVFVSLFGASPEDMDSIYLTLTNPIFISDKKRKIISHVPGFADNYSAIRHKLQYSNTQKIEVYINGYNYDRIRALPFVNNREKYYDIYEDENIAGEYSIAFNDISNKRLAYYSLNDQLYKDIIHIPKTFNPNRIIYTYNEMRIFIRDKNGKGIFVSYIADESIAQLTFNDLSIPSYIVDSILDFLNDPEYTVFIKLLKYTDPIYFVKGGNFISKLYKYESDANIKKHFNGEISSLLSAWTGNALETSPYIKALYEFNFNNNDVDQIRDHIHTLGYYYYMSLICPHVYEFTGLFPSTPLRIKKPLIYDDIDISAIVYKNGFKVPEERITVFSSKDEVSISFTGISILTTDIFKVRLFPSTANNVYTFTPSALDYEITLDKEDYDVFIKVQSSSINIKTLLGTVTEGYRKIAPGNSHLYYFTTDTLDGKITFSFDYSNGLTFYIKKKDTAFYKRIQDNNLSDFHTLAYDLSILTKNSSEVVPMLDIDDIEVYLNGYYLIKDIDFSVVELKNDSTGTISGYHLVIQNMKYLSPTSNTIDVYGFNNAIENEKVDFIINSKIMNDSLEELWENGLSYFIIGGKIVPKSRIRKDGFNFSLLDEYPNGTPCVVKTMIPTRIKDIFAEYENEAYFHNLAFISQYLFKNKSFDTPPIVLASSYRIYSSYLNEIIRRILNDEISISATVSGNINQLLSQLQPLDYLKQFDVIFSGNQNNIDLRFVDIYPMYLRDIATTEDKLIVIKAFIKHYLSDAVHDTNVVYTE